MTHKLIITAQYYENYASANEDWDGKQEYWKAKGGSTFLIDASGEGKVDAMVYSHADTEAIVEKILAKKSNLHVKYELVDIERIFSEPEDITAEFVKEFEEAYGEKDGSILQPIL